MITRMSTRFDREWTRRQQQTEANVSVLTSAWKVVKHCADEDATTAEAIR
jgi:hypothetical protein